MHSNRSSLHNTNTLSPESTVTSLLLNSGHLTGNLQPVALSNLFCYKDKEYDSASSALDAYITDFEHSRRGDALTRAGLVLPPFSPHNTALRNKDVLRERLTERELDFLSLPVSSLHHRSNRDRISMTTNELLNLPDDGSMPITHTTAFMHNMLSKSGGSHSCSPGKNPQCLNHSPRVALPIRTLRCDRCGAGTQFSSTLQPGADATLSKGAELTSAQRTNQTSMHLPHWLSSNKAELGCSDIHSLPDLPYPPWIQHWLDDQSASGRNMQGQSEIHSQDGEIEDFPCSFPSWLQELDEDQHLLDSERSLQNLRFQVAEHILHSATERTNSLDSISRDRQIQFLIQKADRVLNSLQNSATGSLVPPDLDNTEELLLQDLEPQPSVSRVDQPSSASEPQSRPLEDLKQILFRLQAVETELHRRHHTQQRAPQETEVSLHQSAEAEEGPSLQRALLHLSRLKLLVDKPQTSETVASAQRD